MGKNVKDMKLCFIMVGVPGSGKSTLAHKLIDKYHHLNVCVFSLDNIRISLFKASRPENKELPIEHHETYAKAFQYCVDNPSIFNAAVDSEWKLALQSQILIVDNTNLTRKSRARWIQDARANGFTVVAINMMVPLNVAISRQKTRQDKSVPDHVLREMYFRQQEVLSSEARFIYHVDGLRNNADFIQRLQF